MDQGVAPLTELLGHPDETVRAVAARALARIGTEEAARSLAETLNDPSELTRLRMAENLERIGTLSAEPLIETLEGDASGQARVLAARILGYLRAAEARPALKRAMLEDGLTDLRAQATLSLGKMGNPEDVPAIQEAVGDEEWPVRAQAANALEMIGDVSTIPALQELTVDRGWWVRLNASRALANIGPEGERALARVLEGADRYARDRAVATLEERGVTRRVVGELDQPGEKGEASKAMVGAMIRAGATKYLTRLAGTMPEARPGRRSPGRSGPGRRRGTRQARTRSRLSHPNSVLGPAGAVLLVPLLCLLSLAAGCGGAADEERPAGITSFEPSSGVLQSGEPASASVRVENRGTDAATFWVGYSVRDVEGRWYDAPPRPVFLEPGARSGGQEISTGPLGSAGAYDARVSVWDERPGGEGAERLADAGRADASTVAAAIDLWSRDDFASLETGRWRPTEKRLGRGRLEAENVAVEDEKLRITLPAGTLEGGEIESTETYSYGSYAASIEAADAPSSIAGFFLYATPDFHTEIDVEIFNDESGRVLFTTYANGEQPNTVEKRLPFDATAGFHEYRIDFYPTKAEFSVDGRLLHTFDEGLPGDSMQLMVNAWYPDWLPGEEPERDSHVQVDWIQR